VREQDAERDERLDPGVGRDRTGQGVDVAAQRRDHEHILMANASRVGRTSWPRSSLANVPWVTTMTGRSADNSGHQLGGVQSATVGAGNTPTRCRESGASLRGNSSPGTVSEANRSGAR